jgi:hypothetical protein
MISGNTIGAIVGTIPLVLMVIFGGVYLSTNNIFRVLHAIIMITASVSYCWNVSKLEEPSWIKNAYPILIALLAHVALSMIEKGEIYFNFVILSALFPYFFVFIFGGAFIPIYFRRMRGAKILKTGIDAQAFVEKAEDCGARLREGVHRSYKVKLTLRIEGHRRSPYRITDYFWVSEFYIHRITSSQSIPVKVDREDHNKIVLNF